MKVNDKVMVLETTAFTNGAKESYKGKVGTITKILVNKGKIQPLYPVWVEFELSQFEQKTIENDQFAPFPFSELVVVEES